MNQDEADTFNSPSRRKPRKLQVRSTRTSVDESATDLSHLQHRDDDNHHDQDRGHAEHDDNEALESFNRPDHQLPALPMDEDSYLHEDSLGATQRHSDEPSELSLRSDDGDVNDLDEKAMRRHLMDVESSFMPESAPAQTLGESVGVDDTYLELAKPGTPSPNSLLGSLRSPRSLPKRPDEHDQDQDQEQESHTPDWQHAQDSSGSNGTEQDGGESVLSPAAAASQRWN